VAGWDFCSAALAMPTAASKTQAPKQTVRFMEHPGPQMSGRGYKERNEADSG
jgi:hypothetical protein